MRLRTKADGLRVAKDAITEYKHQAKTLNAEASSLKTDEDAVKAEVERTWQEVGAALLPAADPATLQQISADVGWPQLALRRAQLEGQRSKWAQRLQEVDADPRFRTRGTLLEPVNGSIAQQGAKTAGLIVQVDKELAEFEIEPFVWLTTRDLQKETWGGFDGFMHSVTFGNFREARMQKKCCTELGHENWEALQTVYSGLEARKAKLTLRTQELVTYRKQVVALADEQARLHAWVYNFEGQLLTVLRSELAAHLQSRDPADLRQRVEGEAKLLLAKVHALGKKADYFTDMQGYLAKEVQDREKRVGAISAVRGKWAKRPSERLTGDKSKWLVALPQMKREATKKRVRWTRSMHEAVYEYDDYDDYGVYMGYGTFLAYDAFAHAYEDRVPYEGFSRGVLSELDGHREQNGQDGADYGFFKGAERDDAAAAAQSAQDDNEQEALAAASLDETDVMSEAS